MCRKSCKPVPHPAAASFYDSFVDKTVHGHTDQPPQKNEFCSTIAKRPSPQTISVQPFCVALAILFASQSHGDRTIGISRGLALLARAEIVTFCAHFKKTDLVRNLTSSNIKSCLVHSDEYLWLSVEEDWWQVIHNKWSFNDLRINWKRSLDSSS
jgi:hypothetical protein